jgi:hypothetical protein
MSIPDSSLPFSSDEAKNVACQGGKLLRWLDYGISKAAFFYLFL